MTADRVVISSVIVCGTTEQVRGNSMGAVLTMRTYVENKAAQASASWHYGGFFQRQITPRAAQASASPAKQPLGPRWPATQALLST